MDNQNRLRKPFLNICRKDNWEQKRGKWLFLTQLSPVDVYVINPNVYIYVKALGKYMHFIIYIKIEQMKVVSKMIQTVHSNPRIKISSKWDKSGNTKKVLLD